MSAVTELIPLEIKVGPDVIFRLCADGSVETDWQGIEEHAKKLVAYREFPHAVEQSVILCAALVGVAQQIKDDK